MNIYEISKGACRAGGERTLVRQALSAVGKDKILLTAVSCILARMISLALTDDAKFVFLFVEIKHRASL